MQPSCASAQTPHCFTDAAFPPCLDIGDCTRLTAGHAGEAGLGTSRDSRARRAAGSPSCQHAADLFGEGSLRGLRRCRPWRGRMPSGYRQGHRPKFWSDSLEREMMIISPSALRPRVIQDRWRRRSAASRQTIPLVHDNPPVSHSQLLTPSRPTSCYVTLLASAVGLAAYSLTFALDPGSDICGHPAKDLDRCPSAR